METIINLGKFIGFIVAFYFIAKHLWFYHNRLETKKDLERMMSSHGDLKSKDNYGIREAYNYIGNVKALLLIRGHYLPVGLRVAAENWVEEMEEKSKGK